jgi:hypothetical protein
VSADPKIILSCLLGMTAVAPLVPGGLRPFDVRAQLVPGVLSLMLLSFGALQAILLSARLLPARRQVRSGRSGIDHQPAGRATITAISRASCGLAHSSASTK